MKGAKSLKNNSTLMLAKKGNRMDKNKNTITTPVNQSKKFIQSNLLSFILFVYPRIKL